MSREISANDRRFYADYECIKFPSINEICPMLDAIEQVGGDCALKSTGRGWGLKPLYVQKNREYQPPQSAKNRTYQGVKLIEKGKFPGR